MPGRNHKTEDDWATIEQVFNEYSSKHGGASMGHLVFHTAYDWSGGALSALKISDAPKVFPEFIHVISLELPDPYGLLLLPALLIAYLFDVAEAKTIPSSYRGFISYQKSIPYDFHARLTRVELNGLCRL